MWYFHEEDHHQPKYANIFERNDIFCDFCYSEYVPFSVGAEAGFNLFFIGLGITAYGFCYFDP
jgi:beta-carotene 3-hydroxylase